MAGFLFLGSHRLPAAWAATAALLTLRQASTDDASKRLLHNYPDSPDKLGSAQLCLDGEANAGYKAANPPWGLE